MAYRFDLGFLISSCHQIGLIFIFMYSLEGLTHGKFREDDKFLDTKSCWKVCLVSACTNMQFILRGRCFTADEKCIFSFECVNAMRHKYQIRSRIQLLSITKISPCVTFVKHALNLSCNSRCMCA